MNPIQFTVHGTPAPMGSKKAFYVPNLKRAVLTDTNPKKRKAWAAAVSATAALEMRGRELIRTPVQLRVSFFFARPQSHYGTGRNAGHLKDSAPMFHSQSPDLDKLIRCLGDALSGIVIHDDRQICQIISSRYWTATQERAEVQIKEISTPPSI
jgi:crossover junction endodeoxyribonuclease RusA